MLQDIPSPDLPRALRVPDWPLPAYRYVPGLHPHPFRHEGGHMYIDGSPPEHIAWQPVAQWSEDRLWMRGLDLFDQRFYWECHEAFEAIWHQLERGSVLHTLAQGVIQASASVLKTHMKQEKSAAFLLSRATEKLRVVQAKKGDHYRGIELAFLMQSVAGFSETGVWPTVSSEVVR